MRESIKLQRLLGEPQRKFSVPVPTNFQKHFQTLKRAVFNGDWGLLKSYLVQEQYSSLINFKDSEGFALIHVAALQIDPEIIKQLLDAGAHPDSIDFEERTALHLVVSGGCRCSRCLQKRIRCIEVLVAAGATIDSEDKDRETPLYYAARNMFPECAETLLTKGCNLYHWNDDTSVATLLAEYIPSVISNELDKCIKYDAEDNSKLQVDFSLILQLKAVEEGYRRRRRPFIKRKLPHKNRNHENCPPRETELLQSVLKARMGKVTLIGHPVIEAFLNFKWLVVWKFFYLLRSVYFVLMLLYTIVIFRLYSHDCYEDPSLDDCNPNVATQIMTGFLYGSALAIVLSESYKFLHDGLAYLSSGKGYLWWILSFTWIITLLPVFGFTPRAWQYPIATFGIIYSWVMTLVQLGRIPWFAVHVSMLVKVVRDFLGLLFTFATMLIAFSLGFYILIPYHKFFDSIPRSVFKVFLMMKGDIDYEGALNEDSNPLLHDPAYAILAHIIFSMFVIVVTILLTSLIVGLAVKGIEEVQKEAPVKRSIRLIKEIGIFESIIRNRFLTCGLSEFLCRRYAVNKLPQVKNYSIKFSPLHPDDHTVPQKLKQKFIPYMTSCPCQMKKSLLRPALLPKPPDSKYKPHFVRVDNDIIDSDNDIVRS